jgi:hypothetical protein
MVRHRLNGELFANLRVRFRQNVSEISVSNIGVLQLEVLTIRGHVLSPQMV